MGIFTDFEVIFPDFSWLSWPVTFLPTNDFNTQDKLQSKYEMDCSASELGETKYLQRMGDVKFEALETLRGIFDD